MSVSDRLRRALDAALEATVVGSFSRLGFSARRRLFHWDREPLPDLTGRVVVVTGASSGLGLAAAEALAGLGAGLWIVGRDRARLEAARPALAARHPSAQVEVAVADFAVLDDVRALAARVREQCGRVDGVIHNAGALTHTLEVTRDCLETTAQVHVVAPFLLTTELLPVLRASSDARVITVSSGGMYTQRLDLDQLQAPRGSFDGVRAYANAKRAQVVLNERWARAESARGIAFHAMHPGWTDTPGLRTALPRFHTLTRPVLRTPSEGADTMVWLAASPEAGRSSGEFWLDRRTRAVAPVPGTRTDKATTERLWEWCTVRAASAIAGSV